MITLYTRGIAAMHAPALPEDEILRLQALHECALLDSPPEARFDRLTRLAQQMFGTPIALVSLVDADRQWFKSRQGLDASETGRNISFCGHAILGKEIFEVPDTLQDPRFADNPLVSGPPNIRFYAGAPLSSPEGYRVGTLCIIADRPRQLTAGERQTLRDLADCVEDEINQVALKQKSHALKQARQLGDVIARAQSQFIRESDRRRAFDGLLADILTLTGSKGGCIGEVLRTAKGHSYLKTLAISNPAREESDAEASNAGKFSDPQILLEAVLSSKKHVIAETPAAGQEGRSTKQSTPGRLLGIPVFHGDDVVAMISVSGRPQGYDEALIDFLQPLLSTLGQLVVAARIQQQHREDQRDLARFKNTLDRTLDCVFMFDAARLRYFYVNEGGMRQVGYTRDELLNMHTYDIKPDFDEAQFRTMIAPLRAREQDSLTFETIHLHKYGRRVPVEIFLQYIAPEDEPARFVAIVRDLTERKRVDRMKSEFVSTVSHELRTPLTSISGALGLLAGGALGALPEEAQNLIGIAHQNSQRLTYLINDLLDMEKLLAGRMRFDMQPHVLAPLMQQAIRDIQSYAGQRQVSLRLAGLVDDVRVVVDLQRLQQVMANLLSNAAKFSPEGGVVVVEVFRKDAVARIEVKDNGPGIPAEFRDRIFQKFSQADASDSRQKSGTGLGLAISRELVERMGGQIGFDSMEGAGATFFFELPIDTAGQPAHDTGEEGTLQHESV
jgi:PAS domain S-box-containing protein